LVEKSRAQPERHFLRAEGNLGGFGRPFVLVGCSRAALRYLAKRGAVVRGGERRAATWRGRRLAHVWTFATLRPLLVLSWAAGVYAR
jgi:hypothetical protein